MSIREWSFGRVLLISGLWALAVLLLLGWRALNAFQGASDHSSVVGISAGISDLLMLAALILGPPLGLVIVWLVQRD